MHWNFGYGWGMGMGLGCLLVFLFWVLVILGFIYFIKLLTGGKKDEAAAGPPPRVETPLDVIKMRYARGEITREEYERMIEDLRKE